MRTHQEHNFTINNKSANISMMFCAKDHSSQTYLGFKVWSEWRLATWCAIMLYFIMNSNRSNIFFNINYSSIKLHLQMSNDALWRTIGKHYMQDCVLVSNWQRVRTRVLMKISSAWLKVFMSHIFFLFPCFIYVSQISVVVFPFFLRDFLSAGLRNPEVALKQTISIN